MTHAEETVRKACIAHQSRADVPYTCFAQQRVIQRRQLRDVEARRRQQLRADCADARQRRRREWWTQERARHNSKISRRAQLRIGERWRNSTAAKQRAARRRAQFTKARLASAKAFGVGAGIDAQSHDAVAAQNLRVRTRCTRRPVRRGRPKRRARR